MLACVTAVVGDITRDVLIGAVPPASIASWHNPALAVVAGPLVFRFSRIPVAPAGTAHCVFLRLVTLYRGRRLPVASFRSRGGRGGGQTPISVSGSHDDAMGRDAAGSNRSAEGGNREGRSWRWVGAR